MTISKSNLCPVCGGKGKGVKRVTIESLLTEEARLRVASPDNFRFCPTPTCDVAYFRPGNGERFVRQDVRVRIGLKETEPPRSVCYCFHHSVEEIEAEVAATGTSRIPDQIADKCRQGLDRCEETNPKGSCCLGDVRRAVNEAQGRRPEESSSSDAASGGAPSPSSRASRRRVAGAVRWPPCKPRTRGPR